MVVVDLFVFALGASFIIILLFSSLVDLLFSDLCVCVLSFFLYAKHKTVLVCVFVCVR